MSEVSAQQASTQEAGAKAKAIALIYGFKVCGWGRPQAKETRGAALGLHLLGPLDGHRAPFTRPNRR